jgi:hypothetical protein
MSDEKRLLDILQQDFDKTDKSSEIAGSSSYNYVHAETPDLIAIIEEQLLRLCSAVFHGEYPNSKEKEEGLKERGTKTIIWFFNLLAISKGVNYEDAHLGDWLIQGLSRFKEEPKDPFIISPLLFKCGELLELISITPPNNEYKSRSLIKELAFFIGCLGGAIKLNSETLINKIKAEFNKSTDVKEIGLNDSKTRIERIKEIRKNTPFGGKTRIIEVLGSNERGTLGKFCQALDQVGVDLMESCSKTETSSGEPVMHYIARIKLPDTMDIQEMLKALKKRTLIKDFISKGPECSMLDATEDDWVKKVSDLIQPTKYFDVWINGVKSDNSYTHAEVKKLELEQEKEQKYKLFYKVGNNRFWLYGNREPVPDSEDKKGILLYLAQHAEGIIAPKNLKKYGVKNNPSGMLGRCLIDYKDHLTKDPYKGWEFKGSTCCIVSK